MKTINKLLLITVLSSVLNAGNINYISQQKNGWYKMDLTSEKVLEKGLNKIKIGLEHKEHDVVNAEVKVEIKIDNKTKEYFTKSVDELGNYIFEIDLPNEGTYDYKISFNRVGENIQYFRGTIRI